MPPEVRRFCTAAFATARSAVGSDVVSAPWSNPTTPMSTVSGWASMNADAACCAAASRLGATSSALMLLDTSIARMTVPALRPTGSEAVGPATATASSPTPARENHSPSGRLRRPATETPAAARAADRRRAASTAPTVSAAASSSPRTSSSGYCRVMLPAPRARSGLRIPPLRPTRGQPPDPESGHALATCEDRSQQRGALGRPAGSGPSLPDARSSSRLRWVSAMTASSTSTRSLPVSTRCSGTPARRMPDRSPASRSSTPSRNRARNHGSPESTRTCSPVSASSTTIRPTSGSASSAASTTRNATTSFRCASRMSGRSHSPVPMKSEITTTRLRRARDATVSSIAARSVVAAARESGARSRSRPIRSAWLRPVPGGMTRAAPVS